MTIKSTVRGCDVFLVQSGYGNATANDALMELLIIANAVKMASARRVIAVLPYFPYSKQSQQKRRGGVRRWRIRTGNTLPHRNTPRACRIGFRGGASSGIYRPFVGPLEAVSPRENPATDLKYGSRLFFIFLRLRYREERQRGQHCLRMVIRR